MHQQSHFRRLFQIKQVKPEQGWGRPELRARHLLLIYSLANLARASPRHPETFGRCPGPCAVLQHKVLQHRVERSRPSQDVTRDRPTAAAESLTPPELSNLHPPGVTSVFPHTEPKEIQPSPKLVTPQTSTKRLLIEWAMKVRFFSSLGVQPGVPAALQSHRCALRGAQPCWCTHSSLWTHLSDQALGQNVSLLSFSIPAGISWEQGCSEHNRPGSHIGGNWKASKFMEKAPSKPRYLQFQASVEQDT